MKPTPPTLDLPSVLAWLEKATAAELQAVKAKAAAIQADRYGPVGSHAIPVRGSK